MPTPAGAASIPGANSSIATFDGHNIDLAQGWGGARSCIIWRQRGIAQCFRTEAELGARESQVQGITVRSRTTTCSSSLDLYSGQSFGGLHLALRDEGYWQQLSYFGFNKLTVSFLGGACGFHLAEGSWGQGYWYPGNTGPWSTALDMGSWDRRVSSVYIN